MKRLRILPAAFLGLFIAAAAPAAAAPQVAVPEAGQPVVKVQADCHADVRRHYLPEYGGRVWHRHRQSNCRPILAEPGGDNRPRDCHRDVERHYLPQYGRSVRHRHVGESCRIVLADQGNGPRDCHRDIERHYLPQYGRSVYHRHVGESCRIKIYRPYEGSGQGGPNCVRLGPVLLCESY